MPASELTLSHRRTLAARQGEKDDQLHSLPRPNVILGRLPVVNNTAIMIAVFILFPRHIRIIKEKMEAMRADVRSFQKYIWGEAAPSKESVEDGREDLVGDLAANMCHRYPDVKVKKRIWYQAGS
ncbi:hypothetical protein BV25DRAFT_1837780 [Artomyces pyxidatus]|uniref:Uncharacterized protein n=1 Tax=Artomyces pyxidatus TaxID=48021 RepID=A0ACB8T4M9_9AGAM|nr:hypothetical protein BV25DRAFT_1837780 [Artomyces pyxidatus]